MRFTHEYLATVPFDLYGLTLLHLVADLKSFTGAAAKAGLTQSAISRQVEAIEEKLGRQLLERTTRRVLPTAAGREFLRVTRPLLESTGEIFRSFQEGQGMAPATLRVGVARSIGLAYYPGFFFSFRKHHPEVLLQILQQGSREILEQVESGELDAGLVCPPRALPAGLTATHRFQDDFILVLPPDSSAQTDDRPLTVARARSLTRGAQWLLIEPGSRTGIALRAWLRQNKWPVHPGMELDSFDTIVNLVSLGLGISLVPSRVLALYGQRRAVRRISIRPRFSRTLAVVIRKGNKLPEPLTGFVENILF